MSRSFSTRKSLGFSTSTLVYPRLTVHYAGSYYSLKHPIQRAKEILALGITPFEGSRHLKKGWFLNGKIIDQWWMFMDVSCQSDGSRYLKNNFEVSPTLWHCVGYSSRPGGIFTVRIFITKLSFRHSETSILTERKGSPNLRVLTFPSTTLSAFFLLQEARSRIKTVAWWMSQLSSTTRVGFPTAIGTINCWGPRPYCMRGSCRRTGSGVASRMCVSANERYCPTPPHPTPSKSMRFAGR